MALHGKSIPEPVAVQERPAAGIRLPAALAVSALLLAGCLGSPTATETGPAAPALDRFKECRFAVGAYSTDCTAQVQVADAPAAPPPGWECAAERDVGDALLFLMVDGTGRLGAYLTGQPEAPATGVVALGEPAEHAYVRTQGDRAFVPSGVRGDSLRVEWSTYAFDLKVTGLEAAWRTVLLDVSDGPSHPWYVVAARDGGETWHFSSMRVAADGKLLPHVGVQKWVDLGPDSRLVTTRAASFAVVLDRADGPLALPDPCPSWT